MAVSVIDLALLATSIIGILSIFIFVYIILGKDKHIEVEDHEQNLIGDENDLIHHQENIINDGVGDNTEAMTKKRLSKLEKKRIKSEQKLQTAALILEKEKKEKEMLGKWRERYGQAENESDSDSELIMSTNHLVGHVINPHSLDSVQPECFERVLNCIQRDKVIVLDKIVCEVGLFSRAQCRMMITRLESIGRIKGIYFNNSTMYFSVSSQDVEALNEAFKSRPSMNISECKKLFLTNH